MISGRVWIVMGIAVAISAILATVLMTFAVIGGDLFRSDFSVFLMILITAGCALIISVLFTNFLMNEKVRWYY